MKLFESLFKKRMLLLILLFFSIGVIFSFLVNGKAALKEIDSLNEELKETQLEYKRNLRIKNQIESKIHKLEEVASLYKKIFIDLNEIEKIFKGFCVYFKSFLVKECFIAYVKYDNDYLNVVNVKLYFPNNVDVEKAYPLVEYFVKETFYVKKIFKTKNAIIIQIYKKTKFDKRRLHGN